MKKYLLAAAATAMISSAAIAAVTFDPATGAGFVGKGDVQLAFGWNNSALQKNATGVSFEMTSTSVAETTWTCDKDSGPQLQERENTTTTTTEGLVNGVARDGKNQVTGFNLSGFTGGAATTTTEREGPRTSECPTGWTATNLVVGEPIVTGAGLFVKFGTLSAQLQ